jgi:hypothetical protein
VTTPPTRTARLSSLLLAAGLALLPTAALAVTSGPSTPPPPPTFAPLAIGDPVRDWFALAPDTDENNSYLTYADFESWRAESNSELPQSSAEMDEMGEAGRQALIELTTQAPVPPILGIESLFSQNLDEFVGFSLFATEQVMNVGTPPNDLSILRVESDANAIGETLISGGYSASDLAGATLYSINDDYGVNMQAETRMAQLGLHNRIAVIPHADGDGSDLLVARATAIITSALAAHAGEADSLFDDMGYRTLGYALDQGEMAPGSLVGLRILGGEQEVVLPALDNEDERAALEALLGGYAEEPLPPYRMAAFADYRDGDERYLVVALVLAPGESASPTASILGDRLQDYVSTINDRPLTDFVEITTLGSFINELEVAYVTVRALPDAPPSFGWDRILAMRDTLFLAPGE